MTMRKLHWISLALIAAPVVLMHACGGDDSTPGGTAGAGGSGTAGSTGSGGAKATGGGGAGGAATGTGGSTGTTGGGGTAGSGGAKTDGGGGTTGGGGAKTDGGGGALPDVVTLDVPVILDSASDANATCTLDGSMGKGQTCNDYCTTFMTICNSNSKVSDTGMFYANAQDCKMKCNQLNQDALCCRAYHVNNAAADGGDKDLHCPHAAGLMLCQ